MTISVYVATLTDEGGDTILAGVALTRAGAEQSVIAFANEHAPDDCVGIITTYDAACDYLRSQANDARIHGPTTIQEI